MAAYANITLARDGAVARLVLNRPDRRNALTHDMMLELEDAFATVRDDLSCRVLVLRGAGGHFSAGGDLDAMADMPPKPANGAADPLVPAYRKLGDALFALNRLPQAIVAIIEGSAVGGGFGLACCSDVVILHESARLGMPEPKWGFIPSQILPFVVRRVGEGAARDLAVTGRVIDGAEAHRLGVGRHFCANTADLNRTLKARARRHPEARAAGARHRQAPGAVGGNGRRSCRARRRGREPGRPAAPAAGDRRHQGVHGQASAAMEQGVEQGMSTMRNYRHIDVKPIAGALGAEIEGVDMARDLDAEIVAEVRHAFLEHLVIFLRDQKVTPQQQLAFAKKFGEPIEYPQLKGLPELPMITPVVKLEHERNNFGGIWHSDTTYLPVPPMGSMLLAREVPPYGGDTMFANQYLAYEALSDGLKQTLDGLIGVSSSAKADVTKTREDALKQAGAGATPKQLDGRASDRAHPSRDRPQGALHLGRAHRPHQGLDGEGEPASAAVPVGPPDQAGIHLPFPVARGLARLLGQSLRHAQSDQRLSRLPPRHAPHYAGRRQASLEGPR